MSTLKSSAEDLTLNADGSGNDVIIQSDGSTKAIITAEGNIGIGVVPESDWDSAYKALQLNTTAAIGGYSSGIMLLSENYKYDGGHKYITTSEASRYMQSGGTHSFYIAPSGSADASITWTTGFEVLADGKARAKNGLLFGTDTAAANALDDYEEGNHACAFTSTSGSITVGRNDLAYTKIGNMVHMTGEISISSVSSPVGSKMSLPFATAGHTVDRNMTWGGQGLVCYSIAQLEDNPPCLYANAGESVVNLLYQQDDGAFADYNAAAGDTYMFSFSYKTDS
jgi:hypothetical protein